MIYRQCNSPQEFMSYFDEKSLFPKGKLCAFWEMPINVDILIRNAIMLIIFFCLS